MKTGDTEIASDRAPHLRDIDPAEGRRTAAFNRAVNAALAAAGYPRGVANPAIVKMSGLFDIFRGQTCSC